MDLNFAVLQIIDYLVDYDHFDTLASSEIGKRAGSYDELNKIREKSQQHIITLFPDAKFRNSKNQFFPMKKLKEAVSDQIAGLSKNELDEYLDILKKDAKKIKRLYNQVTK